VVLLKDAGERGFVFYTNMQSDKSRELEENPQAALCFYWTTIGEQVRVEGKVTMVSDDEADAYFASRDRESRIGAWASDQSRELDSRKTLEERFKALQDKYDGIEDIPRPPHWSGYVLVPDRIEFWINQPHRLHDRFLYEREGDTWKVGMLYP
jgi:pyridoxamine 5'-phosphate oxidase